MSESEWMSSKNSENNEDGKKNAKLGDIKEKSVTANELLMIDEKERDAKIRKISERHMMEEKQLLRNLKKKQKQQDSTP